MINIKSKEFHIIRKPSFIIYDQAKLNNKDRIFVNPFNKFNF